LRHWQRQPSGSSATGTSPGNESIGMEGGARETYERLAEVVEGLLSRA
jgi:hypothetical protein